MKPRTRSAPDEMQYVEKPVLRSSEVKRRQTWKFYWISYPSRAPQVCKVRKSGPKKTLLFRPFSGEIIMPRVNR
jgi:hypothetical protein